MHYFAGIAVFCLLHVASGCGSGGDPPPPPPPPDDPEPPTPSCCSGLPVPDPNSAPTEYPASNSPADGPGAHNSAAVCYFYRESNCLICSKGTKTAKCCTTPPDVTDDTQTGGPTPYNEFLIGKYRFNTNYNKDWHNLYPKKNDNSNYFDYDEETETGRNLMGLHPGTISEGCVTVKEDCWSNIEEVVSSGNVNYILSWLGPYSFNGFLYVRHDPDP